MRILALNPPFHNRFSREMRSPAVTKSGTLYYPMWLAYAVGALEKAGHSVLFIDAPALCIDSVAVIEKARHFRPELVLMDTSTPSIYNDIHVAGELKAAFQDLFTILVGPHVSAEPEDTLNHSNFVDAVAIGEYDDTVLELVSALEKRVDISTVQGLAYKKDGAVVRTGVRQYMSDLDSIPFVSSVYKKHLDHTHYFYGHSLHPIIVTVTGRGCPFLCTYCVYPQTMHGRKYRFRSVENVVAEFEYIHKNFPDAREIMIEDDTLTVNRERCRELSRQLIERKLNTIPWSANSRADVDYETMALMRKAGCRLFCVGFESGDQAILDNIKKGTKLDKIRQFAKDARRAGIMIHGCFMVGNRGETRETLKKTLDFAIELNPDTAQFFPIMVYPGTDDYEWVRERGFLVSQDFSKWVTDKGLHNSVVSNPDLTFQELVNFCDESRKKFYLRPAYMWLKLKQSIFNPAEGLRNLKAFKVLVKHLLRAPIYKQ
ncbi:MAG: radical SAM protein [Fibrobacteres bacterium]|nr:radical SAM protein [Fibrobacterota bacterium]